MTDDNTDSYMNTYLNDYLNITINSAGSIQDEKISVFEFFHIIQEAFYYLTIE